MKLFLFVLVVALLATAGCSRKEQHSAQAGDAERGRALAQTYGCGSCHTIPGVPMARGMVGPPLWAIAERELIAGILANTPENRVRWLMDPPGIDEATVMPDMGIPEEEARDLAAFLGQLTRLKIERARDARPSPRISGGDSDRGKAAIQRYACPTCHLIPGVPGADHMVGPPLATIARRHYLAGALPNTPDNMIRWVMRPRDFEPRSAMPNLGVTEPDARDIAAFLYTLR